MYAMLFPAGFKMLPFAEVAAYYKPAQPRALRQNFRHESSQTLNEAVLLVEGDRAARQCSNDIRKEEAIPAQRICHIRDFRGNSKYRHTPSR